MINKKTTFFLIISLLVLGAIEIGAMNIDNQSTDFNAVEQTTINLFLRKRTPNIDEIISLANTLLKNNYTENRVAALKTIFKEKRTTEQSEILTEAISEIKIRLMNENLEKWEEKRNCKTPEILPKTIQIPDEPQGKNKTEPKNKSSVFFSLFFGNPIPAIEQEILDTIQELNAIDSNLNEKEISEKINAIETLWAILPHLHVKNKFERCFRWFAPHIDTLKDWKTKKLSPEIHPDKIAQDSILSKKYDNLLGKINGTDLYKHPLTSPAMTNTLDALTNFIETNQEEMIAMIYHKEIVNRSNQIIKLKKAQLQTDCEMMIQNHKITQFLNQGMRHV